MIKFEAHPKQKEFIEKVFSGSYSYLLFGGAAGGGKSYVSLAAAILYCKIYPGSRGFIVRESLPTLKRTTIKSFFKLCPRRFIRSYNQTDQVVRFNNGSEINFMAENFDADKNLTRFDGIEANFFIGEEAQELQQKTFEKMKLRAGRHIIPGLDVQPRPLILLTCNPSQNWTKSVFYDRYVDGNLPSEYSFTPSLMIDNPSLPESYLQGLENIDEVTKAIFVEGRWDVLDIERPFAYSFKRSKSVVKGLTIEPKVPLILSFDFNVDPITCLAGQSYGNKIRILHEFRLRNSDIYKLCETIRAKFGDQNFIVTGDASGGNRSAMTKGALNFYQIIKNELDLSTNAFKVPSMNPSIKNSRVLLNSLLDRHPDFLIDESCTFTISDLETVQTDNLGDIDKSKDASKTHLLDCLRYYLFTFHSDFVRYFR
jgi:hypothetical protein